MPGPIGLATGLVYLLVELSGSEKRVKQKAIGRCMREQLIRNSLLLCFPCRADPFFYTAHPLVVSWLVSLVIVYPIIAFSYGNIFLNKVIHSYKSCISSSSMVVTYSSTSMVNVTSYRLPPITLHWLHWQCYLTFSPSSHVHCQIPASPPQRMSRTTSKCSALTNKFIGPRLYVRPVKYRSRRDRSTVHWTIGVSQNLITVRRTQTGRHAWTRGRHP